MKYLFFPRFLMDQANPDGTGGNSGGSPNSGNNNGGSGSGSGDELEQLRAALEAERNEKKTLQSSLTKLTGEVDQLKKTNLRSQNDFKTLYEGSEKEKQDLQTNLDKLKQSVFHTARVGKVKEEAMKLGLRQEALADIEELDLENLEVKVGDNRIISVSGADSFAAQLKKMKGHWFKSPDDPAFNAGGNGGGSGGGSGGAEISQAEFQEAYRNRNKSPELMAKYRTMAKKYDEQTRAKRKAGA